MHYSKPTLFSILYTLVTLSNAQHNITVNNTSPSIQYEGTVLNFPLCKLNSDGQVLGNQGGCFHAQSQCSQNASMGTGVTSDAASFSFKGSAIYINSLLNMFSPMYTVTLDGNSTDVDGFRQSRIYLCETLFSQTGLDPSVEHKIRLSAKGPSPQRNDSSLPSSETDYFSLQSYIFTASDDGNTTSTVGGSQPVNATTNPTTSSAQAARLSGWCSLVVIMTLSWVVVS